METKNTIVTEELYVESRLTMWDTLRGNFFFAPVVILVVLILVGLFFEPSDIAQRIYVGLFVVLMVISIAFRMSLSAKIARLRVEYQEFKEWRKKS